MKKKVSIFRHKSSQALGWSNCCHHRGKLWHWGRNEQGISQVLIIKNLQSGPLRGSMKSAFSTFFNLRLLTYVTLYLIPYLTKRTYIYSYINVGKKTKKRTLWLGLHSHNFCRGNVVSYFRRFFKSV